MAAEWTHWPYMKMDGGSCFSRHLWILRWSWPWKQSPGFTTRVFRNQRVTSQWPCPSSFTASVEGQGLEKKVGRANSSRKQQKKERQISLLSSFSFLRRHSKVTGMFIFLSDGLHDNTCLRFGDRRKHGTEGAPPWGCSFGVTRLGIEPGSISQKARVNL